MSEVKYWLQEIITKKEQELCEMEDFQGGEVVDVG
jgi:hypothetical protein